MKRSFVVSGLIVLALIGVRITLFVLRKAFTQTRYLEYSFLDWTVSFIFLLLGLYILYKSLRTLIFIDSDYK